MPNWCDGELTIHGKDTKEVLKLLCGSAGKLDFNKVVRNPREHWPFKQHWGKSMADWRIRYWGTKWNVGEEVRIVPMSKGAVKLHFSTAWAPPVPIIGRLADRFPENTFTLRYWEGGMGFRGKLVVKDDEVLENFYTDSYKGHRGG